MVKNNLDSLFLAVECDAGEVGGSSRGRGEVGVCVPVDGSHGCSESSQGTGNRCRQHSPTGVNHAVGAALTFCL